MGPVARGKLRYEVAGVFHGSPSLGVPATMRGPEEQTR